MARPDLYVLECAFASDPDALLADQVWTDITAYLDVKAGVRIGRGRTDELSDIQPSTLACTLKNDGRFTPGNTSSPYYPNVKTGKRIRLGLLRKGAGKQFDPNPSFTGDPPFAGSNPLYPWESKPGFPVTFIYWTPSFAQHGTASMQLTLPTASAANAIVRKFVYGLTPGQQYTASVYIRVPTGTPAMVFGCSPGGVSATTVNDAFQRRSITFTATGTSCEVYLYNNAGSTSGQLVQVDAMQVEEGAVATAFEPTAGSFTWRFTGEVNEWPTAWDGGPALYAASNMSATDKMKRLGELGELRSTLDEDTIDDSPFAYYPLSETSGAGTPTTSAGDASGNDETPLTARQVGSGGGIGFGHTIGVPDFYVGKRTVLAVNPASAGNGQFMRAVLKAPPAVVAGGAAGAAVNVFSQESATPYTPSASLAIMTGADGSWFGVRKATSGNITASFYNADTGTLSEVVSGVGLSNLVSTMLTALLDVPSAGNGRVTFYISGVQFGTPVTFPLAAVPTWVNVTLGGRGSELYRGYLSHASFYNYAVGTDAMAGWWYSAFRGTDGGGSNTYVRLNKLCVYTKLETPLRASFQLTYDPEDVGAQEIEGPPIEAMRLVETTENGQFFIRGNGQSVLCLKNFRYNATAGLTITSDKLDPDALSFRGDDFGLQNDVTANRSDGATARIVNEASVTAHGRRKGQLDALSTTDDKLRALAAWRANTWGTQRNRITGVRISLLNDPASIIAALGLDIGSKITITTLPSQAPASTLNLYVEGWTEVISEDEWSMSFNTSPGEMWDVWQIGTPGRSEIGLTTRIGH